jgi:hypothetical protein
MCQDSDAIMGDAMAHNKQVGSNECLPPKKKRSEFFTLSGPPLIKPPALPISPVDDLYSDAPDDGSISNMFDH